MKKLTALLLLMITIWSLASLPMTRIASARPIHTTKKTTDKIVYTDQSTTYHRSCCKHMSYLKPISLSSAQKKNYTPCKVCNP